ncbi:MAG: cell division protein FtsA [Dehalococcoidales bacterium]|nr:cell division protein FtsA [Dehalococcoidales bacterium]
MRKRTTLAAIDVGTTKVCTIIAEVNNESVSRIIGVGIAPSKGMHKGMVININDAKESIRESVRRAERTVGHKLESAYVGMTGRHIVSLNNRGAIAINRSDRLVRPDDLKRVLQSAQNIKVPSDRRLIHVIPRSYALDGQVGVKNPVGMHGFKLDVETHIITAAVTSIQNLVKCIRGIGIDIDDLILEPVASSEAVLSEDEKQKGVILADIGGGTTDISIFKEGSIWRTSVISVAGYQFTRDIAIGLGLPFDVAEEMKKQHGSVLPVYEGKTETPAAGRDSHTTSYQDLCDIIRARVEELLKLILLEIPTSEYKTLVPAGLVLTGGSSNLSGIDILGREILHLPVRVGNPIRIDGLTDLLHNPAYATVIGLLLWGAKHQGSSTWQSQGPNLSRQNIISWIKNLFH